MAMFAKILGVFLTFVPTLFKICVEWFIKRPERKIEEMKRDIQESHDAIKAAQQTPQVEDDIEALEKLQKAKGN